MTSAARRSTLLGVVAILFWSTTIAFSRSLTEQLGTLTAGALIYLLAGMIGLGVSLAQGHSLRTYLSMPKLYLLGCGALFVAYIVLLYLAVGSAATRTQVLAVGLINYLWPGLSLVFSIPILGGRAKPLLPVGILLALAGVWLATTGSEVTLADLLAEPGAALPYGLSFAAAVCWALYSNLSRKWAGESEGNGVPLFLLASGAILGLLRLAQPEVPQWSARAVLELLYMALFPGMLAYVLWDVAVRRGEILLVASLSYLTPLLSTLFSSFLLAVRPSPLLWLGALLIIAGAVLCKRSITEPRESGSVEPATL